MKTLAFIGDIFRKFPLLFITNIVLLFFVNMLGVVSLLTISPVIDLFIHPELKGISPLTQKAVDILKFIGLPITLGNWLIIFGAFVLLSSILLVFVRYSTFKTKYAVMKDIILGTFDDFFYARWYFFSSGKQGVLLNTFTRELSAVGDAFGATALFFAGILQTIFFLAVPFYISWRVTVISLCTAILFTIPFILLGKLSYRMGILGTNTANHFMSVIHENINLAKLILGFGNQHKGSANLAAAFCAHQKITIKAQTLTVAVPILYRPFSIIVIIVALLSAQKFSVPLSEMVVLLLSLFQVGDSISNLVMQRNSLTNFFPSYEQIKRLRNYAKELKQASGSIEFKGLNNEICIEGLSFAYPNHEPTLVDINARISKGKMVAFIGGSGAGKSTLLDMIMGFHQPTKGRIVFDDILLQDYDIYSYRRKIGYVPQNSVLFNMTIKDNLLWASESATDEEIAWAAHQANADEFINKLPQGYNTLVGDRGVRLSGGQVQRIALAMAILRKPSLLILDEATSSLDTYSERLIQEAIENIAKETTVVVVAHRLSTIVNADYIYVLEKGRIIEEGTYHNLMNKNGHFNKMVRLQMFDAAK